MDSFSFVISDKASDDLNRIYVYIANVLFSVDSAKRQIKRLYVAITALKKCLNDIPWLILNRKNQAGLEGWSSIGIQFITA